MMTKQQRIKARKYSSLLRKWSKVIALLGIAIYIIQFALTAIIQTRYGKLSFDPANLLSLLRILPLVFIYMVLQVIINTYDLLDSCVIEREDDKEEKEDR